MTYPMTALTEPQLERITAGYCPICGHRGFVIGPRGGSAINIECGSVSCRQRYNVAQSPMSYHTVMGQFLPGGEDDDRGWGTPEASIFERGEEGAEVWWIYSPSKAEWGGLRIAHFTKAINNDTWFVVITGEADQRRIGLREWAVLHENEGWRKIARVDPPTRWQILAGAAG